MTGKIRRMDPRHKDALRRILEADEALSDQGKPSSTFIFVKTLGNSTSIAHPAWDASWATPSETTIDDLEELNLLRFVPGGGSKQFSLTMKGREAAESLAVSPGQPPSPAPSKADHKATGAPTPRKSIWQKIGELPIWESKAANVVTVVGGTAAFLALIAGLLYTQVFHPVPQCSTTMKHPTIARYEVVIRSSGVGCERVEEAVKSFERDPSSFIHSQTGAPYNNLSQPFLIPPASYSGVSDLECRYTPQGLGGTEHTVTCTDGEKNSAVWRTRQL